MSKYDKSNGVVWTRNISHSVLYLNTWSPYAKAFGEDCATSMRWSLAEGSVFAGQVLKQTGSTSYLYFACCLLRYKPAAITDSCCHRAPAPTTPLLWYTESHYVNQNVQGLVRCLTTVIKMRRKMNTPCCTLARIQCKSVICIISPLCVLLFSNLMEWEYYKKYTMKFKFIGDRPSFAQWE